MTITPTYRPITPTNQRVPQKLHTPSPQRPNVSILECKFKTLAEFATPLAPMGSSAFARSGAGVMRKDPDLTDKTPKIHAAAVRQLQTSSTPVQGTPLLGRACSFGEEEPAESQYPTEVMSPPSSGLATGNPLVSPQLSGDETNLRSAVPSSLGKVASDLTTRLDTERVKSPVETKRASAAVAAAPSSTDATYRIPTPVDKEVECPKAAGCYPQLSRNKERAANLANFSQLITRTINGYNPTKPPAAWIQAFPAMKQSMQPTSSKAPTNVDRKPEGARSSSERREESAGGANDQDLEEFLQQLRDCSFGRPKA